MRKIKFRFWLSLTKKMIYSHGLFDIGNIFQDRVTHDVIYMQWTGIKDKQGTEIYEADILEDTLTKMTYVVKFGFCKKSAFTGWYCENENAGYVTAINGDYGTEINSQMEVIGNLYELPYLRW